MKKSSKAKKPNKKTSNKTTIKTTKTDQKVGLQIKKTAQPKLLDRSGKTKILPVEASFNKLIKAWLETSMDKLDVPGTGVDFSELMNRISTIFRVTCKQLQVSVEDAEEIAWSFGDAYAIQMGEREDYVCPDCQKEHEAELHAAKISKELN